MAAASPRQNHLWTPLMLPLAVIIATVLQQTEAVANYPPVQLYYELEEEVERGHIVGNLVKDSSLDERYTDVSDLHARRFHFLSEAPVQFDVDLSVQGFGDLRVAGPVDRDKLCPNKEICTIKLDIACKPVEQLQIIKVSITLLDLNDMRPRFVDRFVRHSVLESATPGASFTVTPAVDSDSPAFSVKSYRLESDTNKFQLRVTEKLDGTKELRIVLKERLDHEKESSYRLRLVATDGGSPPMSGSCDVIISVQDSNDNNPVFIKEQYEITVPENTAVGRSILKVKATDPDGGLYGSILYSFTARSITNTGELFSIHNTSGVIRIAAALDFERAQSHTLTVLARDRGPDSVPAESRVTVYLTDVNDNEPVITVNTLRDSATETAEVYENMAVGTFLAHMTVVDADSGQNGRFNCSLNDNNFRLQQLFPTEYQVVTASALDREDMPQFNLALMCRDQGVPEQVAIKHLKVIVQDRNDHVPRFLKQLYVAELIENNFIGAVVAKVNATDKDEGLNSLIQYRLDGAAEGFRINAFNGEITASRVFDREVADHAHFKVLAVDQGAPPNTATANVKVTIKDVNDRAPTFNEPRGYVFHVHEHAPAGSEVGKVIAEDLDGKPYNDVEYALLPGSPGVSDNFAINPRNGRIRTKTVLDREVEAVYYLVVISRDSGSPPLSSSVSVSVFIKDINDHSPDVLFPADKNNTVEISNRVPLDYVATRVLAVDRDAGLNAKLQFSLSPSSSRDFFAIDKDMGVVYVIKDLSAITYETFELTIRVQDKGIPKLSKQATLLIVVDKDVAYEHDKRAGQAMLGPHFAIVIIVSCATLIIAAVLVACIVCLRRSEASKQNHRYNCRMEAIKMLASRDEAKEIPSSAESINDVVELPNGQCPVDRNGAPLESKGKKEVSFSLDVDVRKGDHVVHNDIPPFANVPHPQQVHQLLDILRRDGDGDSAYSDADGSNTDSGRGGSEEGNHSNGFPTTNGPGGEHKQPPPPAPPRISSARGSRDVMSNARTMMKTRSIDSPRNSGGFLCQSTVTPTHCDSSAAAGGHGNHSDCISRWHCAPYQAQNYRPLADSIGGYYSLGRPYAAGDNAVQYNNNNSSQVALRPPEVAERREGDHNSSTSGSYVIDPRELCNQIDELFFKKS